jgi:hypothetical protein
VSKSNNVLRAHEIKGVILTTIVECVVDDERDYSDKRPAVGGTKEARQLTEDLLTALAPYLDDLPDLDAG